MLRLSQSVFSAKEIASIMSKSADTINFYRKCVYEKLDVKNIAPSPTPSTTESSNNMFYL